MTVDLLAGLDSEQRHAVTTASQPLIIRAGAGSGKTRVLTRRVAYRAAQGNLDPRHALCVTFTREAAGELRSRLRQLGLRDLPAAGTFHAIALGLLRGRWHDLRQAEPSLLTDRVTFLRRVAGRSVDGATLSRVTTEIDWARARSIRPDRYHGAVQKRRRRPAVDAAVVERLYGDYEAAKRKARTVDFDDLLERCADAFRQDEAFAQAQRWRFRHLFVDEFQDVNPLQFRLLQAWLGPNRDVCAVGDANQAIYGWNGADPTLFDRLVELLDGGEVVELRTNHRSSPAVVAVSGAALPDGAAPRPSIGRPDGAAPSVRACRDATEELVVIAGLARRWHDRGISWRDQAVLVRTNAQVTALVEGLERIGVPAATAGTNARDLQRRLPALTNDDAASLPWADFVELITDDALVALAGEYAAIDLRPTPAGFLRWAVTANADEGVTGDAVRVGTFHRAKGREWRAVVVAGVEDGFVPASSVRLDEERRLFYVALSRATEELVCTWAQRRTVRGSDTERRPSPFLAAVSSACDVAEAQQAPRPMPAGLTDRAGLAARNDPARSGAATGGREPVRSLADAAASRVRRRTEALQRWRETQARLARVSPAAVLDDATLSALAADPPADADALAAVGTIGPLRARRFGPALLAALQA